MIVYLAITAAMLYLAVLIQRADEAAITKTMSFSGAVPGLSAVSCGATRGRALARICLVMIFLIMVIPEALRMNVGNDYMKYVEFMHLANVHAYVPTEPGFNWLVRILYGLCGYENYLLVFAVFAAGTALFFLLAIRQQAEHFAFSFFLFLMFGYYFQSYNTVRYYFALALSVYALRFFLERQYIPFAAIILIAAGFHKSVLVVLVLYPLCAIAWKWWQVLAAAALGAFINVPGLRDLWLDVLVRLYPSYDGTEFIGQVSFSWGNIARCAAILLLALFLSSKRCSDATRKERFYFRATLAALGIYVFGSFVPEVSRICYYLTVTHIFYLPVLADRAENLKIRKGVIRNLLIAAAFLYFLAFARSMSAQNIRILPYQTIVFHDLPKILSEVTQ